MEPGHFRRFVSKTFLADPITMVKEGYALFAQHGFAKDVGITIWRVVGGLSSPRRWPSRWASAMGAYKPIEAFFEPFRVLRALFAGVRRSFHC